MLHRMKTYPLEKGELHPLLSTALVGSFSTLNANGYPYTVPVHFAVLEDKIYVHGLPVGQKIENIRDRKKVCFEIHEMKELIVEDTPCGTNTTYESVVVVGNAQVLDSMEKKKVALLAIVEKYTPKFRGTELPEERIRNTAVIEITPIATTGKYYR